MINPADNALRYFYQAWQMQPEIEMAGDMYFPTRQLEQYLHLPHNSIIPNILEYDIPMTDGTWWVGEHRTSMQYNAKFSEIVDPNNQIFRFLLKVSSIHTTWGERTL